SLFGMNVDILESNPPWWLYLPLAGGTILLTLTVWIIFKRNSELEDDIERRFSFIFFRRAAAADEESLRPAHGYTYEREESWQFSVGGEKRS
ncbi:hypothetical protein BDV12DRAFT_170852, partial [Aspergillus spectabilis]